MTNADHILTWCENSQPHWRKLTGLKPGNFIRESGLSCAAFNLAVEVSHAMIAARDISRSESGGRHSGRGATHAGVEGRRMSRKYAPRRAGARWRESVPDYVLDCFDHPDFADRYTVIFTGERFTFHVRADRRMAPGPDQFGNTWLMYLGTSEGGHVSGSGEFEAYQAAAYRYRNKHRRVRWLDLPDTVRTIVQRWAESD